MRMINFSLGSLYPAINSRYTLENDLVGSRAILRFLRREKVSCPCWNFVSPQFVPCSDHSTAAPRVLLVYEVI